MPFNGGGFLLGIGVISQLGDFIQCLLQVIFTKGGLPAGVKFENLAKRECFADSQ